MTQPPMNHDLIDKYRDINLDEEWWQPVYAQWVEKLGPLGIETTSRDMQFRGFWSQGDGASFTGTVFLAKFLAAHPDVKARFPAHDFWLTHVAPEGVGILVRISSHYCHEDTVGFEVEDGFSRDYEDRCEVMDALISVWREKMAAEGVEFDDEITSICRGYMSDLYSDLEDAHDYHTCDEQVWESIVANELHLDVEEDEAA